MGVEVVNGVALINRLENIGVVSEVHSSMFDELKKGGYNPFDVPGGENTDDLIRTVEQYDLHGLILRTNRPLLDEEIFKRLRNIRLLIGACRDPRINRQAAIENGVWTLRSKANTLNVAIDVLRTIESLGQGLLQAQAAARDGKWEKKNINRETFKLKDRTIGIIGFGEIGRRVAIQAISRGMKVVFYNDGPGNRNYDREITKFLQDMKMYPNFEDSKVEKVNSIDELMQRADIATLHTNTENWEGEKQKGMITESHLRLLQQAGRLGIFINFARADLVEPDPNRILKLLQEGILKYYVTDVYPPSNEHPESFQFPIDTSLKDAWRFIGFEHIGGSGPEVSEDTVNDISRNLIPAWQQGFFRRGDSLLYTRNSLDPVSRNPGDIVLTLTTSTRRKIINDLTGALGRLGLNITDIQSVGDNRDGTKQNHGVVPRTFVIDPNGQGDDYKDRLTAITDALFEIPGISSLRPIPTNKEQEDLLKRIRASDLTSRSNAT